MPQGGIDRLENPMIAALRELREETGIVNARIVASVGGGAQGRRKEGAAPSFSPAIAAPGATPALAHVSLARGRVKPAGRQALSKQLPLAVVGGCWCLPGNLQPWHSPPLGSPSSLTGKEANSLPAACCLSARQLLVLTPLALLVSHWHSPLHCCCCCCCHCCTD